MSTPMSIDHAKTAVDIISVSAAFATLAGWLPSIAALLSIVWTVIRIIETKTVQRWINGDEKDTSLGD